MQRLNIAMHCLTGCTICLGMARYFSSIAALFSLLCIAFSGTALAATPDIGLTSPVAVAVPITGSEVAFGDIIAYDSEQKIYLLTQYADDPRAYGIAQKDPPVLLLLNPSDVPIVRSGAVLMNVTLENGPIEPGDGIIASSVAGKGMRASQDSKNVVGLAREAFTGAASSTDVAVGGKNVPAGTIVVEIRSGLGDSAGFVAGSIDGLGCTPGTLTCAILQKINTAPLITLTRYLIAAGIALGSLYLAFRSFVADAVNGVLSVGRNPRAKAAIQAMVVFNAVLAAGIALAGLAIGLIILFIQI